MDILVISDLHYVERAEHVCPIEARRTDLGPALVRGAFRRLSAEGVSLDVVVVLGDAVDDGLARGAEEDLVAVAEALRQSGAPVMAVPGNHDGAYERFAGLFACSAGLHDLGGGYGFLVFHDQVGEGHVTTRPSEWLGLPTEAARQRPDLSLIALQHNPLALEGQHDYPFVLSNANAVLDGYREAGVLLSMSGHYHPGRSLCTAGGVACYIAPAACEAPFRFAHVRLAGGEVNIHEMALLADLPES